MSSSSSPPILAITKTFLHLLSHHIPKPIRAACWGGYLLAAHLVHRLSVRVAQTSLARRIPPRLHRPVAFAMIALALFLAVGLPLALAQGPAFHCFPFPADDPLSRSFGSLSPHCCAGPVDGTLRVGKDCLLANEGHLMTSFGQELRTCGVGRREACCVQLKYPPEIQRPPMSYCDEGFLVKPDSRNIIDKADYKPSGSPPRPR